MKKIFTLLFAAAIATAAHAETLTVCDGTVENSYAPMYGLYYDTEGTTCQMIYPEDLLTELQGAAISKLTFFARDAFAFGEGSLQLGMGIIEQNAFASNVAVEGANPVATGAPVDGETELVFTLDEPFVYNGGNLLVQTVVEQTASFKTAYFYGTNTTDNSSLFQYSYSWSTTPYATAQAFLPKVEIEYTKDATAIQGMTADKTVAGVRYYNMAGQQMRQPSGATIVVTTYTDGTTSTSKIVK